MNKPECDNPYCNKTLKRISINCLGCNNKYCSEKCLNYHQQTSNCYEENSYEEESFNGPILRKRSSKLSKFMKEGIFLKVLEINPMFDMENFDMVTIGKAPQIVGQGIYGNIYLAKNKLNSKQYAIKRIEKERMEEENISSDIIYNEINLHLKLIHDHIIRLHSFTETQDSFYLIMDYASNSTLKNLIKRSNGLEEKEAFIYFMQLVSAVHFLHEYNLVHRDIKPENVLIDEKGEIKLCDFGWCAELKLGNRLTFCGTYEYMAPEVIDEVPYDQGSDVWSLGVVLYEILHGISPFESENDDYNEIFKKVKGNNLQFRNDLSPDCEDLILKLLNKNKEDRMRTKDIFSHPWAVAIEKELVEKEKKEKVNKRGSESTKAGSHQSNLSLYNEKNQISTERESRANILNSKTDLSNISKISIDLNDNLTVRDENNESSLFYRALSKTNEKLAKKNLLKSNVHSSKETIDDRIRNSDFVSKKDTAMSNRKSFNILEEFSNELNQINEVERRTREQCHKTTRKQNSEEFTDKASKKMTLSRSRTLRDDFFETIPSETINYEKAMMRKVSDNNYNISSQLKKEALQRQIQEFDGATPKSCKGSTKELGNYTSCSNPSKNTVIVDLEKFKKNIKKEEKEAAKKHIMTAMGILEKAGDSKTVIKRRSPEKDSGKGGFWSIFNPFKCGGD